MKYDFCGWATKNNLRCADGLTIRHGAFSAQDGCKVPLVYNHQHDDSSAILGHAILENRDEGVYAYCSFNNNPKSQEAKEAVRHGDVESLSIWANQLQKEGSDVLHGVIREVSLVLAGANPGAFVESVLAHSEPMGDDEDEGILYTGEPLVLSHADSGATNKPGSSKTGEAEPPKKTEEPAKKEDNGDDETVRDVYDTLTEKQKKAVAIIVGQAIADSKEGGSEEPEDDETPKEGKEMKHNMFSDGGGDDVQVLSHADYELIFNDARRLGSLREAVKQHSEEGGILAHAAIDTTGMTLATGTQKYGFNDPSMLFPEYKTLNNPPEWISRNMDWVSDVMSSVHHTPFSRIKSVYANITEDEARARGYIKGKQKKEEVFTTLKRTTDPQTVYKKQKLDRDDQIDITDFDVVAWIRAEMRVMLDEELARAYLIGDGRPSDSDDKISAEHIRPVVTDVPLFNTQVKVEVAADADEATIAKETINAVIRSRKNYKGSGNPKFYTTEDVVTEMLLIEDGIGHKIYKTEAELATALRVSAIVTVEPMEGQTITIGDDKNLPLIGTIVNLVDYNVGADKGGEVNMFEDFDIDYNQNKYLIETRCSGALVKPFSAITLALKKSASAEKSTSSNATA